MTTAHYQHSRKFDGMYMLANMYSLNQEYPIGCLPSDFDYTYQNPWPLAEAYGRHLPILGWLQVAHLSLNIYS